MSTGKKQDMAIGVLSRRTGVNIETIRYYERIGILPKPPRTESGRRVYNQAHLRRVNFVRRARALGFSLDDVRSLLRLVDGGDYTCAEVQALALRHRESVRRRMEDLKNLERVLNDMLAQCEGGSVPECPIVDILFAGSAD